MTRFQSQLSDSLKENLAGGLFLTGTEGWPQLAVLPIARLRAGSVIGRRARSGATTAHRPHTVAAKLGFLTHAGTLECESNAAPAVAATVRVSSASPITPLAKP